MASDNTESDTPKVTEQSPVKKGRKILKDNDFSKLADELTDVVMIVSLPGRNIEYVNRAVKDVFGYTPKECIGKTTEFLYPTQADYIKFSEDFTRGKHNGRTVLKREITQRRKNGESFLSEHSARLLLEEGVPFAVTVIIRDVTSFKKAVRQLAESESNSRNILEILPIGVMVMGSRQVSLSGGNSEILFANRAMLDIYGYESQAELVSTPPTQRVSTESMEMIKSRLELIRNGHAVPNKFEISVMHKSGQAKHLEVQSSTIMWNGELKDILFYFDATERKAMEEQLRHAQVLASLGEMTAGITHEVGNPLASIVLYSEVAMKNEGVSRQTKKDLKVIHDEAKRAASLMKDLLAYSRKLAPNFQSVDVCAIIRRVVELRQYQARVRNIKVDYDSLDSTVLIRGDQRQLIQVFMNLLMNAEEAVGQIGGGNITFLCEATDKRVRIYVKDDGPGVPEANINKIFMPFFSTKKIGEGTGLGLSICYGIITAHKGTINVSNNPGGYGATFTVDFPAIEDGRQPQLL